ncbi:putative aspartate carbamoyltransferase [Bordetella holmesii 30539]|uniref:Aspartate carbamoyltransferase n=1 Tax=Bordetella holmesii 1058 TaxID=1247648 RepID=A0ABP3BMX3_9BORD|nr:putative aspartate carbamoyltransferase [Bordetella holmesii ATCC 51541]AIT26621.1 putative aspartate carbamoyltransferase [Bordetella holmesii 44057]EWM43390.1 putative aspartate carbamoyltransferase [Bordetella holmesii 41130]EWM47205.1 putative aspartate carbamoyltransferase [Bordetella holmesii 35009]EXF88619.1 putative aspartate carbamoyltransferase [Bordetella holmesii 30539]EXX96442.1 putative aspartate carbamoyltransferase [Bordetella holmesii 1058]KAK90254.1 aspartate carbamoyltra
MADLRVIRQAKGGFTELRVAFVGDFAHSGRARSLAHALTTLGAPELRAAGPRALLPDGLPQLGLRACASLAEALDGADVVVDLGLTEAALSVLPSAADYARRWAVGPLADGVLRVGAIDRHALDMASRAVLSHLMAGMA